ncbi:hypothetical protein GGI35DRAFT_484959 [Trichoderma velutinum]
MDILNHWEPIRCYACNQPLPYYPASCNSLYDLYLEQFQPSADAYQSPPQYEISPYPLAPLLPDATPESHQVLDTTVWYHSSRLLPPAYSDSGTEGAAGIEDAMEGAVMVEEFEGVEGVQGIEELSDEEREAVLNLPGDERFVVLLRLEKKPVPWKEISVRYERRYPKPVAHTALAMRIQRRKQMNPVLDRLLREREKKRRK